MQKGDESRTPAEIDAKGKPPSLLADTRGLTTVEYIIILCLIAVVGFAVWQRFGKTVRDKVDASDQVMQGLDSDWEQ